MGSAERRVWMAYSLRGSSLYNTPLSCDFGGFLRSKLLSDKGQEYWFSRVLTKIHMIWKRTSRHWGLPHVMKRAASSPWLLLDEKAHHLRINHRDLSKLCQNFPQETLLDFFQHMNNYSVKSPEFHAIKKGRNYSGLEIFSG